MIKLHLPKQTPYIVTNEKYTNFEKHNFFMKSFDFKKKFARTKSRSCDKYVWNYLWKMCTAENKNLWANHSKLARKELSKAMLR